MKTRVILFTFSYFFFTSSNITLLKKIRTNIYRLWPMFHVPFRGHVSTVLLYLELISSVYPDENHWTVVRLRLDLLPGTSLLPSNQCVYAIATVKRTWERGWSSPICIIFFQFQHRGYFTNGRKSALPQAKQTHIQGALSKRSM